MMNMRQSQSSRANRGNYFWVAKKRASVVAQAASLLDRQNAIHTKAGWQPALRRFAANGCAYFWVAVFKLRETLL